MLLIHKNEQGLSLHLFFVRISSGQIDYLRRTFSPWERNGHLQLSLYHQYAHALKVTHLQILQPGGEQCLSAWLDILGTEIFFFDAGSTHFPLLLRLWLDNWNLQSRDFDNTHEFQDRSGSILRGQQPDLFLTYVECDEMERRGNVDRIKMYKFRCLIMWDLMSGATGQSDNST